MRQNEETESGEADVSQLTNRNCTVLYDFLYVRKMSANEWLSEYIVWLTLSRGGAEPSEVGRQVAPGPVAQSDSQWW